MQNKIVTKLLTCALSAGLILSGCGNTSVSSTENEVTDSANEAAGSTAIGQTVSGPARDDISVNETIENNEDGEHAIEASGEDASYSNVEVIKTGDSDEGDEADFYGDNVAIFATDGATWTLTGDSYITALACDADSINLNGYTLYVNGEEYTEGSEATGDAITLEKATSSGAPDGGMPEGKAPSGDKPEGTPPSNENSNKN